MQRAIRRHLSIVTAGLTASVVLAAATACTPDTDSGVPGVSETEIVVGSHQPLTLAASAKISAATAAYFDYVNANGGVYGRAITYRVRDDKSDPGTAQEVVRQLVTGDKVFAILNGRGTPTHAAVLDYLSTNQVPDLFVGSGSSQWNQPTRYPDTFGFEPDQTVEGKVIADYVKANLPGKRVCVLGEHDEFGASGLAGVQAVLGAAGIAHSETYEPTPTTAGAALASDTTVAAPAVAALKAAGCQVTVSFSVPTFTALAMHAAAEAGWRTQWIVSNVGGDYYAVAGLLGSAGAPQLEGLLSTAYLPSAFDVTDPWSALFSRLNQQYNHNAPLDANVIYGFSVGYLFVQALRAAGKDLTRQGLVDAVRNGGFAGPGIAPLRYSASDHSGYGGLRMTRVHGGQQLPFGPVYTTDSGAGPVAQASATPQPPPGNGIPS